MPLSHDENFNRYSSGGCAGKPEDNQPEDDNLNPIIETRGLTHIYSQGTPFERYALDKVDFSVNRGEFMGIIGHTGSGKSTLIQHLNGLLKPSEGQVLFDGKDIWEDKQYTRQVRFQVGLVFQYPEYHLFGETVFKDISFGPKNMGLSEDEIRRRVMEAAAFVELDESVMELSPFELSGGQKRRVAIAGVIAMEPKVLILDEPTAGLDPKGRAQNLRNIRDYQDAKDATVLMVSHSMEEIADSVERLVVINDAHIAMDGTPREVFSHAAELEAMGLAVPQVTSVFLRLKELGLPVDTSVYTIGQAKEALLALKGGCADA